MLQALLDGGETPAYMVGASAGAINAACFAGDPTSAGARELEQTWCALERRDLFPFSLGSVVVLLCHRVHLVDAMACGACSNGSFAAGGLRTPQCRFI